MINFEEELKKFHPVLELDEAQEVIENQDLDDVADILVSIMRDRAADRERRPARPAVPVVSVGD